MIVKFTNIISALVCFCFAVNAYSLPKISNVDSSYSVEANDTIRINKLNELIVTPTKSAYKKRGNPAIDLLHRLRHDGKLNRAFSRAYYKYKCYEKISAGINDFYADINNSTRGSWKKYSGLVDTADWTGKRILELSIKENVSYSYFENKSGRSFEEVEGVKHSGIDEQVNQENVYKVLSNFLRENDIYENDLVVMQNHFVSPLSTIADDYYKYIITDTVLVGARKCIEVAFFPYNAESYSFTGRMYVPVEDSIKYVSRIVMRIPTRTNINYLKYFLIELNYCIDERGLIHKNKENIIGEIKFLDNTPELYFNVVRAYSKFESEPFDINTFNSDRGDRKIFKDGYDRQTDTYWQSNRCDDLKPGEIGLYKRILTVDDSAFANVLSWGLTVCLDDHIPVKDPAIFEIGPVSTMISKNSLEGYRFQLGGMTTPKLWDRIFLSGYGAYGLDDHKWKYGASIEWSFNRKKVTQREYPVHSISLSYLNDVEMLAQQFSFSGSESIMGIFTRLQNNLIAYKTDIKANYSLELPSNIMLYGEVGKDKYMASPWITFTDGFGISYNSYGRPYVRATIKYAPEQEYYQGLIARGRINLEKPIFMVSHEYSETTIGKLKYKINKSDASFWKRFWLSSFGYVDCLLRGGIVWNEAPYPHLAWQNSNITYYIQNECFTLLNPMEFAMDKYLSWDLSYFMSGVILNRMPIINRLNLREVVSFKGFAGALSDKNNPEKNRELLRYPSPVYVEPMGSKPYMEIGVGLDNILSFLRLEYIWRLSYLNNPNIDRNGLRFSLHFSF